jgi:hypothetical protein
MLSYPSSKPCGNRYRSVVSRLLAVVEFSVSIKKIKVEMEKGGFFFQNILRNKTSY